jgi:hypothetical protein
MGSPGRPAPSELPWAGALSGKYRGFLGEGLSATKRETMIVKDLRAAHPPPSISGTLASLINPRL